MPLPKRPEQADDLMTVTSLNKVIEFNNFGVLCFRAGLHRESWDLFKGALELNKHGSQEHHEVANGGDTSNKSNEGSKRVDPSLYILRAETRLSSIKALVASSASPVSVESLDDARLQSLLVPRSPPPSTIITHAEDDGTIKLLTSGPVMYASPFTVSTSLPVPTTCTVRFARTVSATIIFNLALINDLHSSNHVHLSNSNLGASPFRLAASVPQQAFCLYKLAATLLSGDETACSTLGMAVINNMGVWCYHHGDICAAQRCMEHLDKIIGEQSTCGNSNTNMHSCQWENGGNSALAALRQNVNLLLFPPHTASAAA
jgi:hypothetical protein